MHASDGREYNMYTNNGTLFQEMQSSPAHAKSTPTETGSTWEQILDEDGNIFRFNRASREISGDTPSHSQLPTLMRDRFDETNQEVLNLKEELAIAEEESLRNKSLLDNAYETHESETSALNTEIGELRRQ